MRPHVVVGLTLLIGSSVAGRSQPYSFTTIAGLAGAAGTADGTNSAARFTALAGATVDAVGNVYVADGNAIRRIAHIGSNWVVSTLAGSILTHSFVDGTNAVAQFNFPQGLVVDAATNLFVADTYNNAVRKVSPVGTNWVVTTLAGPVPPNMTFGTNDGVNNLARFHQPYGIAVDSAGVLYVADTFNHTIRSITPSGPDWVVSTLAGSPTVSGNLDGTGANAQFVNPAGIVVGSGGVLYVADFGGNTIRKVTPPGIGWTVSTLAGQGGSAGFVDGTGNAARFNQPFGIVVDGTGHVMTADSANDTVRRISATGNVSTMGGMAGIVGSADGIGGMARFDVPQGLGLDSTGKIYVTEYGGDGSGNGYTVRQGQIANALQITKVGNQIVLSWPVVFIGYTPEVSSSIRNPSWSPILTLPSVSGDYWVVTNSMQFNPSFYRLFK